MISQLAQTIVERGKELGLSVATAESCTGGLIAGALTDIAGSSAVLDRGFVTYSNEAKTEMLGVPDDLIKEKGAVSDPVARAMVAGALANSRAQIAVAVTGIAGPGGGSKDKPVGLVYVAAQSQDGLVELRKCLFADETPLTRREIRTRTVEVALEMIIAQMG